MCYFAAAEAGGRSLEAAAQVQAADLGLELKCSTDVWLVSVPWLMSCGTGWYHASRWHPRSDQSTVSKCFPTEDTTCPAQLLLQTAACPTCGPRCTARQRNFPSDLQHNYQPLSLLTQILFTLLSFLFARAKSATRGRKKAEHLFCSCRWNVAWNVLAGSLMSLLKLIFSVFYHSK